jgi:hypothetical protein
VLTARYRDEAYQEHSLSVIIKVSDEESVSVGAINGKPQPSYANGVFTGIEGTARVYSVAGTNLGTVTDGSTLALPKGVYILQAGRDTVKFVVR